MTSPQRPRLYTLAELARIAGISRNAMDHYVHKGVLSPVRVGNTLIVFEDEADAWLDRRRELGLL